MNYRETLAYLAGLNPMGIRLGLDAIRSLLGQLGNPQESFPSVLIAGTNGKGSVAAMTASILQAAGFRTGLYTSPDLIDLRERIRIDGRMIGRAEMAACAEEIRVRLREEVSYFEFLTAIAFLYFQQQKVDVAVLEVGLGGRLDATNVVTPLVSVITNISLEHRAYLGNTLVEIAREKAGIIKEGGICLTAARQKVVIGLLEAICRERGARLFRVGKEIRATIHRDGTFSYRGIGRPHERLRSPLAGRHQIANAALALAAVEQLGESGFRVAEEAVLRGLKRTRWPGRLEILRRAPMLIADGAHNPAGAATLSRALRNDFPHRRLILLFGVLGDKDYRTMARRLFPLADRVIVTRPHSERALSPDRLRACAGYAARVEVIEDPRSALRRALKLAGEDDLVCAAGSLYLVGEIKKLMRTMNAGPSGALREDR
ncbi:MAG: bifunctional folylpolyglutamate synthase/dihydrofolate synthase [Deltaproteobacteria bacterium]|nr:bifunctional folylpolyglutamate synthase/dihydrofolate synthase [Deltaproteobacteria bacterium]